MKRTSIVLLSVLFSLVGCADLLNHRTSNTVSSSLTEFLYPDAKSVPNEKPSVPVLTLPIKVGIAFVPNAHRTHINNQEQVRLLNKVKASFEAYEYIDKVEVIPSIYLKSSGGFDTLDQVSRLYDVDVMALVSYDQLKQTYDNPASVLYWSIVGLYVIPGNTNTVQTFVDTAVFDISSRKMLFRAPGIYKSTSLSTAVGAKEKMANESMAGFEFAVKAMIPNLDAELLRFKTRVKEEKIAKIKTRKGYSGGAIDMTFLLLIMIGVISIRMRK